MRTNKCVISFANSSGNYVSGIARLSDSLRNNFDGDFGSWIGEHTLGAPLHSDNPYAFKIHAFQKAIDAGYTQILWLDSSVFAVQPIQPVFDHIAGHGYIMQDAGHFLGDWCNDETLAYFALNKQDMKEVRMIGNAGFLGLDMNNPTAKLFFEMWRDAMNAGMFCGSWDNHRHDMSCSSAIRYKLGMNMVSGDEWLQYGGLYDKVGNDKIYFKAQGT